MKSQEELPVIDPVKVAEFKTEAEAEIGLKDDAALTDGDVLHIET